MIKLKRNSITTGNRKLRLVASSDELAFRADLCGGPSWRLIAKLVAAKHSVTVEAMASNSRALQLARARFEAMWLLRTHTSMSLHRIGSLFGHRDHKTVSHAVETFERRRAS